MAVLILVCIGSGEEREGPELTVDGRLWGLCYVEEVKVV